MHTMSKGSIILRSIYATCLALATITHVLVDVRYGVFLAGLEPLGYPIGVRSYWASLTFLDPAAAILLFVCPRAGLALTSRWLTVTEDSNGSDQSLADLSVALRLVGCGMHQ
jgi:hypothetical protein